MTSNGPTPRAPRGPRSTGGETVMEVSVERDDDDPARPVVMHVAGEVDALTSATLRRELTLHMGSHRPDLIVDLSRVTFFDSTGLSVLVRGVRQVRERGGRMELVVDQGRVVDLLRLTALAEMFRIHRTVEDARAVLAEEG